MQTLMMMLILESHVIVSLLGKHKELSSWSDIFDQHDEADSDIIMNLDAAILKYTAIYTNK